MHLIDWVRSRSAAPEAVECAAVALGWPAGPGISVEHRDGFALGGRWAVIDETLGGDGSTDTLVDQSRHLDDAVASGKPRFDAVTNVDLRRGLCARAVDRDVPAPARISSGGARLAEPHRPQPPVDPGRLHGFMVARAWAGRGPGRLGLSKPGAIR